MKVKNLNFLAVLETGITGSINDLKVLTSHVDSQSYLSWLLPAETLILETHVFLSHYMLLFISLPHFLKSHNLWKFNFEEQFNFSFLPSILIFLHDLHEPQESRPDKNTLWAAGCCSYEEAVNADNTCSVISYAWKTWNLWETDTVKKSLKRKS